MTSSASVLSIDLEFFTHTPAYRAASGEVADRAIGLDALDFVLGVLDEHGARATFFVVSEVAVAHPGTVSAIAAAGHEIASHTRTHRLLSGLTPDELQEEVAGSKEELEDVSGRAVTGFRSPAFEVPDGHFGHLAAAGYEYDSSVAPCRAIPGWYGGEFSVAAPGPATAFQPGAPDGIAELPVAVMPGVRLPLTGAWIRFFGRRYATLGMRWLSDRGVAPVLYVHPWELVDLPSVEGVPRRVYWRTGAWMRRTLEVLLEQPFEFVTAAEVVGEARAAAEGQRSSSPPT